MVNEWVNSEEKSESQWNPVHFLSSISADYPIASNRFLPAAGMEELQVNSLRSRVVGLEREVNELKKCLCFQGPTHIWTATKDFLKPKGNPFDPSRYDWKPSPEELKGLEEILEEG